MNVGFVSGGTFLPVHLGYFFCASEGELLTGLPPTSLLPWKQSFGSPLSKLTAPKSPLVLLPKKPLRAKVLFRSASPYSS